jgi:hypothetical protein
VAVAVVCILQGHLVVQAVLVVVVQEAVMQTQLLEQRTLVAVVAVLVGLAQQPSLVVVVVQA